MSYLVLARRFRPQIFDELIGQEHITDQLKGAITSGRLPHAYLFSGPRGIGKTSCARILAKSLNCQNGPTLTPCGQCPACKEITSGTSFDVMEVDGASNRGIDEIRALRENVKFGPGYGRYKIYIVDEVHMLTTEAFNALLKTLEEPPEHVKFIFATTDPNKIPATIISRCQRYDFKRIFLKTLVAALTEICKKENLTVSSDALYAIAKAAQGSFRDALSILDQISAFSDRSIEVKDVCSMLGLVEVDFVFELCEVLGNKDCVTALKKFDELMDQGKDPKQLSKDLIEHFRNLMVIKIGGKALGKLVDYPVAIKELYLTQAGKFTLPEILSALDTVIAAQEMARVTESLRIPLEIAFAKIAYPAQRESFSGGRPIPASAKPSASISAAPEAVQRVSPVNILKNQKGQVNVSDKPDAVTPLMTDAPVTANVVPAISGEVNLASICRVWDALTHAVSREKMSLATYLQEGYPVAFNNERLSVGFGPQHEFHKSTLEGAANVLLVEKIFSQVLNHKITLEYKIVADMSRQEKKEEEPMVQKVLETFKGTIVSKWHN